MSGKVYHPVGYAISHSLPSNYHDCPGRHVTLTYAGEYCYHIVCAASNYSVAKPSTLFALRRLISIALISYDG